MTTAATPITGTPITGTPITGTPITGAPPVPTVAAPAGPMRRRDQLAFVVFSAWIVAGLFTDGWAHNHHKPETFFTPWHGVLYSGFGAAMAWGAVEAWRMRRRGEVAAPVVGQRLTAIGILLFTVGGVGDFAWHSVFGIENGIEALLSPTHLTLMTGGLLLLTAPLRAALPLDDGGAPSFAELFPVLFSATMTVAVVGFFLQFLSAFRGEVAGSVVAVAGRSGTPERMVMLGIATVLVTTALLVGMTALLLSRWRTPAGSFTFLYGAVAFLLCSLDGLVRWQVVLAAVAAGAVVDAVVAAGRRPVAVLTAPAVLWPAWFVAMKLSGPMVWPANDVSGAVFLAVVTAVGIQALARAGARVEA